MDDHRFGPPLQQIDSDGDLTLIVRSDEVSFLVCLRSLSWTSRVFKQMFSGLLYKGRPAGYITGDPWVAELPEDDAVGAKVLFDIVHSCFDGLPAWLTLADLYDVLVFADKYDMARPLQPWVKTWAERYMSAAGLRRIPVQDLGYALGVACEVGDREAIYCLTSRLVFELHIDDERRLANA